MMKFLVEHGRDILWLIEQSIRKVLVHTGTAYNYQLLGPWYDGTTTTAMSQGALDPDLKLPWAALHQSRVQEHDLHSFVDKARLKMLPEKIDFIVKSFFSSFFNSLSLNSKGCRVFSTKILSPDCEVLRVIASRLWFVNENRDKIMQEVVRSIMGPTFYQLHKRTYEPILLDEEPGLKNSVRNAVLRIGNFQKVGSRPVVFVVIV